MLKAFYREGVIEAGCDEAGRGCLAGPVFAAAVILPPGWEHPLLDDSKQMSERNRCALREIIEREAIGWAVEAVSAERIDRINILNASFEAMTAAAARLGAPTDMVARNMRSPELLLIDGNRFRTTLDIPYECIVGGDAKYASIAAASVLAKTHRDEYMERLAAEFPEYGWQRNKGYPTKQHREAIVKYGLTSHHRKSFRSGAEQLLLF